MKKLHISKELGLPVDAATQTFAFIARKGAGKTFTCGKLVELFIEAEVQVIVLDSVGNWWGLRLDANGKDKGIDIAILGGLRGDIPLEAHVGARVADVIVDTGRSMVLDISQFSKAARQQFATAFAQQLWQRKKAERHPTAVHLVIEESQLIVPENVGKSETTMVGIYEEIIRLGRNYGIGVSMISQRPQSVNKEVLNQTECLFVGQVNGHHEREALKKWIVHQGMDPKLLDELPSLPIGTFYIWSPQWLRVLQKVHINPKWTFDASATPRVGASGGRVRRDLKPLDLAGLQDEFTASIEKAKADDPRELRKRIADLEKQLAKKPAATVESKPPKVIEKPVFHVKDLARVDAAADSLRKLLVQNYETMKKMSDKVEAPAAKALGILESLHQHAATIAGWKPAPNMPTIMPAKQIARAQVTQARTHVMADVPAMMARRRDVAIMGEADGGALSKGERKVLAALIQYPEGLVREQLTVLTGYKRSSRDTYLQKLMATGLVVRGHGDGLLATDEGRAALPDAEPLPTGKALQDHWLAELGGGEKSILHHLIEAYPNSIDKEQLSEITGYKRSSRDTYLQKLRARQLVIDAGSGSVKASDQLFAD